jgi:hypothetical protein
LKIKLEEDYPEYAYGPKGGDILEVIDIDTDEGGYICWYKGQKHFVYEYEVEEEIDDDED